MPWELNLRLEEAIEDLNEVTLEALDETYERDIKPEAVALAPRGETGNLKASIQVEVVQGENGPEGKVFTECGYGGYVEMGIKGKGGPGRKGGKRHHMAAQPFALPAFLHGIKNYAIRVQNKIASRTLEAAQKEMRERNRG